MTLVFQDDSRPPEAAGVHVLVIGVGHYRHFAGGAEENPALGDVGMGQLSSPPHSARLVADWAFDTWADDVEMPLRSVRLLISRAGGGADYAHPLVPRIAVEEAVLDNIELNTLGWHADGERNADNLMVFYFCGHGVATSVDHPLLASDAGRFENEIFRHAVNFSEFRSGMSHSIAQKQLMLIDACRVGSAELVENAAMRGLPLVSRRNVIPDTNPRQPTIKSTLQGAAAFGLADNPSPFAQALTRVFSGAAWRQVPGGWVVCASTLGNAIDARVREVLVPQGFARIPLSDPQTPVMTLKTVTGQPMVPVEVSCSLSDATPSARFLCRSGRAVVAARDVPGEFNWFIELPRGLYDFEAQFADGVHSADGRSEFVSPPFFPCEIEVR